VTTNLQARLRRGDLLIRPETRSRPVGAA